MLGGPRAIAASHVTRSGLTFAPRCVGDYTSGRVASEWLTNWTGLPESSCRCSRFSSGTPKPRTRASAKGSHRRRSTRSRFMTKTPFCSQINATHCPLGERDSSPQFSKSEVHKLSGLRPFGVNTNAVRRSFRTNSSLFPAWSVRAVESVSVAFCQAAMSFASSLEIDADEENTPDPLVVPIRRLQHHLSGVDLVPLALDVDADFSSNLETTAGFHRHQMHGASRAVCTLSLSYSVRRDAVS